MARAPTHDACHPHTQKHADADEGKRSGQHNSGKRHMLQALDVDMFHAMLFLCLNDVSRTILFGNICSALSFCFSWLLLHEGMGTAWNHS